MENKATLKLEDYIVKAWGADYPQLALNEFYLSDNDALFMMRHFDIDQAGRPMGFKDLCVLQAKSRDNKYTESYEQVAKTIKTFTSLPDNGVVACCLLLVISAGIAEIQGPRMEGGV